MIDPSKAGQETAPTVPAASDAVEDLINAVLRLLSSERAGPHAHYSDDLIYRTDEVMNAAGILTQAVNAEAPDRQPVGWQVPPAIVHPALTYGRAPAVCILAPVRFIEIVRDVQVRLETEGTIVYAPVLCPDAPHEQRVELHRGKIRRADWCLVVTDDTGYFGDGTRDEIQFALDHGKPVDYSTEAAAVRAHGLGLTRPRLQQQAVMAREDLGRFVRQIWDAWASEQPDPKPSWRIPWEQLDPGQQEVDMRIGEQLAAAGQLAYLLSGGIGDPGNLASRLHQVMSEPGLILARDVTHDEGELVLEKVSVWRARAVTAMLAREFLIVPAYLARFGLMVTEDGEISLTCPEGYTATACLWSHAIDPEPLSGDQASLGALINAALAHTGVPAAQSHEAWVRMVDAMDAVDLSDDPGGSAS